MRRMGKKDAKDRRRRLRTADTASAGNGAGLNILLVEDDPDSGRFLHRGLVAEGYTVEWQTLGRRAQARMASGLFHAAILELADASGGSRPSRWCNFGCGRGPSSGGFGGDV